MLSTTEVPYVYQRSGVFYFNRRVPKDLLGHYRCPRIIVSLRTRSAQAAKVKSVSLASQLDEEWLTLRWRQKDNPLGRYLVDEAYEPSNAPLLSEAKDTYLRSKGNNRPITFSQAVERAVGNVIAVAGDKPIDRYTRQDANQLRDQLLSKGLTNSSVKRQISTLSALVNFVVREEGLSDISVFSGLYLGDADAEPKRQPIPLSALKSVQEICKELNDEGRWLIALISDSGMRLSEAAGLHKDDVVLNHQHPHLILRPHKWRRLKTKASERLVPLVGYSLWAVTQAYQHSTTDFLFPRYCNDTECKSNSASAALNKWLKPKVPTGCVIHSFRHSFRDRLRAVECPQDITDRLGGWTVGGVGEAYGSGYPIDVLNKWMERAVG
jgi:integrase